MYGEDGLLSGNTVMRYGPLWVLEDIVELSELSTGCLGRGVEVCGRDSVYLCLEFFNSQRGKVNSP